MQIFQKKQKDLGNLIENNFKIENTNQSMILFDIKINPSLKKDISYLVF